MASELKPCPFCAGSNLETYYADIEGWIAHIKCIDCDDMIGPMSEFKYETQEEAYEDASKRWNTRPTPVAPVSPDATGAARDVLAERRRQVSAEGWTPEHDDKHSSGQLAYAASVYALCAASSDADRSVMDEFRTYNSVPFRIRNRWPWDESWLKPTNRRRDLVKAAALILAEIERLDRKASEGGSNV